MVAELQGLGLTNFNRIDDQSDEPVGNVIRTDPTAGDEVPLDQQIDIHVSKGPRQGEPASPSRRRSA